MVEEQIIGRGEPIDKLVIEAMMKVYRRTFVSESDAASAYMDKPLPIGHRQTVSQPYMVALMTHELSVAKSDKVLEVGTGSGYQTAILAELAENVYTVERIEMLGKKARKRLFDLDYLNVQYSISDGTLGWVEYSPFDKIIVTAASPNIPKSLIEQLNAGGILVIPAGGRSSQELKVVIKNEDNSLKVMNRGKCIFVPLLGEEGYQVD
jgi:protein-L-isoaspartate(D-aspartate) O-methyltransferase